jgi:hypothetical protein
MIFIDLFIIIMLVITITFCIKLNHKINIVQKSKNEIFNLFHNFDNTINEAKNFTNNFQNNAKLIGLELDKKNEIAKKVIDELLFVIEKGNKFINQINGVTSNNDFANIHPAAKYFKNEIVNQQNIANSNSPNIVTSKQLNSEGVNETKRVAIEDLLHKISEIQKKAGRNQ